WYTVPAGTHGSYYSQEAADNRALDQINRYGQDYANSAGKCTYYSFESNLEYTKNDCSGLSQRGSTVYYHIPYGKHQSNISQADA
ncbi:DUF5977 domain-containing protein, partial [Flavobacterium collinsii]